MTLVPVYRFQYFDRTSGSLQVSGDFATPQAIEAMGGAIMVDTKKEVPEGEVTFSGLWRPADSRDS